MRGAAPLESRRRRVRSAVVLGIVFVVGICLGVLGIDIWNSIGAAEYLSRQSDLAQIAHLLRMRAEAEGRYPDDLGQVIAEVGLEEVVDVSELRYPAAGDPYDKTAYDKLMLYEYPPRQYGYISGFFEFRQGDQYFRLLGLQERTQNISQGISERSRQLKQLLKEKAKENSEDAY